MLTINHTILILSPQLLVSEPPFLGQRIRVFYAAYWNLHDLLSIIFFLVGMTLRFIPSTHSAGRVMYCLTTVMWYLKLLDLLSVNIYLGPFVNMIGKMVSTCGNCSFFVILLLSWIHTWTTSIFSWLFHMCISIFEIMGIYPIDQYQNAIPRALSLHELKMFSFKSVSRSFMTQSSIGRLKTLCMSILSLSGGVESEWKCCSSLLSIEKCVAFEYESSFIL